MSYEIVSSINEKKHTITCATNNLRPLTYETYPLKHKDGTEMTDDEFRVYVVRNIIEGNFHVSRTHKYNLIANAIMNTKEYTEFDEKLWNWNDTYTKEEMSQNWQKASEDFNNFIIKMFPIAAKAIKEKSKELQNLPAQSEIEIPVVIYVNNGDKKIPEIHYQKFTKMGKYDNPKRQLWWGEEIHLNVSQTYLATQAVKDQIIDEYYKNNSQERLITNKITDIISQEEILSYQVAYNKGHISFEDIQNDGFSKEEVEQILNWKSPKHTKKI